MNQIRVMVIGLAVVAVTAMILPSYAQESLCDHNGPTPRGQALGIVCHSTQDPASMLVPAIPIIVSYVIAIGAFIAVSARKVR
jgi:hypothetical protein